MANQPKKYKKFVATAATATLVASAIVPVASAKSFNDVADNNDHKANIDKISDLGYMGTGDNFNPGGNLTRGQVAIILANWAKDAAGKTVPADYKTAQRFEDVALTADDKLLQSAALVFDNEIFSGSNGNLLPANEITRLQMALVLNKAYGAVTGKTLVELAGDTSDVVIGDLDQIPAEHQGVVKALKKLGITAPANFNPNGKVTRAQFASFFISTIEAKAPVSELKVDSVSAENLKAVTVNFNQAIDTDSLSASTLKVYLNGSTTAVTVDTTVSAGVSSGEVAYVVSEDKKSVKLVFGTTLAQGTDIAIVAEDLKSATGLKYSGTTYATATDIKLPEVLEARALNAKTIEIKFSEPVQFPAVSKVFGEVLIDGNKVAGTSTVNTASDTVTLVLNAKLNPGTYKFSVEQIADFASLKTAKKDFTITAVEDNEAPEVVSVEAGRTQVEVTFNENVDATAGSITIDGTVYNLSAGTVTVDGKKVTVNISGDPLTAAAAFLPQTLTYKGIKDVLGNEVDRTDGKTFTFYAKNDSVKPTASVKVNADNTISVEFSETVQGFATANIELKDADGNNVALHGTPVSTVTAGKEYKINLLNTNVDKQEYTLVIKDVKDDSVVENTMDKFTTKVTINDKKAPTLSGNITIIGTNKARITFDEAMDRTSLEDKSNYLFDDGAANAFESLSNLSNVVLAVASDNKSVDITVPNLTAGDVFKLLNLKDASGTRLDSNDFNVNKSVNAQGTFTHSNITSVVATSRNTVEITAASGYNFTSVDPNKFVLVDASNPSTTLYVTGATINNTGSKVTLTLNSNLSYNALSGSTPLSIFTAAGQTSIKDSMNRALDITFANAITVADGIKPVVTSIEGTSVGSDVDTFAITFSEAIDSNITLTSIVNDILVKDDKGNTVSISDTDLSWNGDRTVLTVRLQDGSPTNDEFAGTYTVQVLDRVIKDEDGAVTLGLNVVESKTVTGVKVK